MKTVGFKPIKVGKTENKGQQGGNADTTPAADKGQQGGKDPATK